MIKIITKSHKAQIVKLGDDSMEIQLLDEGVVCKAGPEDVLEFAEDRAKLALDYVINKNEQKKLIWLNGGKVGDTFMLTQKYCSSPENEERETD